MIHLSFFIRQLSCSETGIFIDKDGRLYFFITGFDCFIEEKINECTLESCTFSLVNRKTCAGKFYTQFKIDDIILCSKLPMWKCICRQFRNFTFFFYVFIIFGSPTLGNFFRRQIRKFYKFCI